MEIVEQLEEYDFTDCPIIKGSALKALKIEILPMGRQDHGTYGCCCTASFQIQNVIQIKMLHHACRRRILITGRGTVATGRSRSCTLHVSDEVEIVGLKEETRKVVVTGIEMFRKLVNEAQAGDNIGALLRGVQKNEIERGTGVRGTSKY